MAKAIPITEQLQHSVSELMLIRESFLRGISTRQVGRLVAILTGEPVSPQSVSRLTREFDEAVHAFHRAPVQDESAHAAAQWTAVRAHAGGLRRAPRRQPAAAGLYA